LGPVWIRGQAAAKARTDAMRQMMQARERGERMSPIDHLDVMVDRLPGGARFGMLRRVLMPERPRFAMVMMDCHMGGRRRVVPGTLAPAREDAAGPSRPLPAFSALARRESERCPCTMRPPS
jgi:hypothetical protein